MTFSFILRHVDSLRHVLSCVCSFSFNLSTPPTRIVVNPSCWLLSKTEQLFSIIVSQRFLALQVQDTNENQVPS